MAYIVKGQGTAPAYNSALAHAPFDRQRDIFKLAKMGSGDCRRLWNDFVTEVPHMARLVVADVENELAEDARITKSVDKRLRQAEKVTKARKPKVTKSRKRAPAAGAELDRLGQARALLADPVLQNSNPWFREQAYQAALRRD